MDIQISTKPAPAGIESKWLRGAGVVLAVILATAHFWFLSSHWSPAHIGSNQNAYLTAGRLIAETGWPGITTTSRYEFVGWMWNVTNVDESPTTQPGDAAPVYHTKYPMGLPLMNAAAYRIGGYELAYRLPLIAASLTLLGIFLIARRLGGSVAGLVATMFYGTLALPGLQALNPYSHSVSTALVTWGMYFLITWLDRRSMFRGIAAGLLLGIAVTVRYTDGLYVLPLVAATLMSGRSRAVVINQTLIVLLVMAGVALAFKFDLIAPYLSTSTRPALEPDWLKPLLLVAIFATAFVLLVSTLATRFADLARNALPALAWLVPVGLLVLFNWSVFGSVTGYDSTNESTAFDFGRVGDHWFATLEQFNREAMPMLLPVAALGLVMLFGVRPRAGVLMWLWLMPTVLLYISYYWGRTAVGTALPAWGYLRFFAGVFPCLVIAAAWVVSRLVGASGRPVPALAVALVFCSIPISLNISQLRAPLERDAVIAANLAFTGRQIREAVPAGSTLLGPSQTLLNYVQTIASYRLYGSDFFVGSRPMPRSVGDDDPTPFQSARAKLVSRQYAGLNTETRKADLVALVRDTWADGRKAFIVTTGGNRRGSADLLEDVPDLELIEVARWTEPRRMSDAAAKTLMSIGGFGVDRDPRAWRILQVVPRVVPPAATTGPSTLPATLPAGQ
jgi:4-amino-4-deoxy-L-arabinose transferase-like glycosyltransferase